MALQPVFAQTDAGSMAPSTFILPAAAYGEYPFSIICVSRYFFRTQKSQQPLF
jgi:hypothetical protein